MRLAPTDRLQRLKAVAALPDQLDRGVAAPQVLGQQARGGIAANRDQRTLEAGRVGEQLNLDRPLVGRPTSPGPRPASPRSSLYNTSRSRSLVGTTRRLSSRCAIREG